MRSLPLWPEPDGGSLALGYLGVASSRQYSGVAASMLFFSWYVSTFDSYNKTYGSLGAAVGFMVWLWISAVIVLLGGEVNAEMEHQSTHPARAAVTLG